MHELQAPQSQRNDSSPSSRPESLATRANQRQTADDQYAGPDLGLEGQRGILFEHPEQRNA